MNITSGNITLREVGLDDACLLLKWWNDGRVMAHAGFIHGLNTCEGKIIELIKLQSIDRMILIIEIENHPVGEMSYKKVEEGIVQIGIKLCEADHQGKGYGTTCLRLLIDYLFNTLNYDLIILDTNILNKRAQRVYEKLGFRKVKINYDSWKDQLGVLQTSIDYELDRNDIKG